LVLAKSARLQFLIACVHIVLRKGGPIKRITVESVEYTTEVLPRNVIVCLANALSERSPLLLLLMVLVVAVLSAVATVVGISDTTAASDDVCLRQYTTAHV
jgi:hypothetical protein